MFRDRYNTVVKNGDFIKTDRGVELEIVEVEGVLFYKNSGNGQQRKLEDLNVDFTVLEDENK